MGPVVWLRLAAARCGPQYVRGSRLELLASSTPTPTRISALLLIGPIVAMSDASPWPGKCSLVAAQSPPAHSHPYKAFGTIIT